MDGEGTRSRRKKSRQAVVACDFFDVAARSGDEAEDGLIAGRNEPGSKNERNSITQNHSYARDSYKKLSAVSCFRESLTSSSIRRMQ